MERTKRRQQTRFYPLPLTPGPPVVSSLVAITIGVEGMGDGRNKQTEMNKLVVSLNIKMVK